jgi:hypothetical protein
MLEGIDGVDAVTLPTHELRLATFRAGRRHPPAAASGLGVAQANL